jgi:hypothetical protein
MPLTSSMHPTVFFYKHLGPKLHILSLTFLSKRVLIKLKHASSSLVPGNQCYGSASFFDADPDPAFNIVAYLDPT